MKKVQELIQDTKQQQKYLRNRALSYVSRYQVTKVRLKLYLKRLGTSLEFSNHVISSSIDDIIKEFEKYKYIDDKGYIDYLTKKWIKEEHHSILAVQKKLHNKGFDLPLIKKTLREWENHEASNEASHEWTNIQYRTKLWIKKHPKPFIEDYASADIEDINKFIKWKKKLGSHLTSKGFSIQDIIQVLSSIGGGEYALDMEEFVDM